MIEFGLTREPIDTEQWRRRMFDLTCGGYAAFEGWVRDHNEGQEVLRLEYEVYETLALSEGNKILAEAIERFGVTGAACVHRHGELRLGDVAVWVGVSAAHRDEAFKACRYVIDEVKIHEISLSAEQVAASHDALRPTEEQRDNPDMQARTLPAGPSGGAFQTHGPSRNLRSEGWIERPSQSSTSRKYSRSM